MDVLTFEVSKAYRSLVFTSADLTGGAAYTLYQDGAISGGSDFHGLYTGATYTGGTPVAIFTTGNIVTYVEDNANAIYLPYVPMW